MTTIFIRAAAERAAKTFAQALLALLGTNSVGVTSLDWGHILPVAATAALASVLTSVASLSTVVPLTTTAPAPAPVSAPDVPEAPATPAVSFAPTQAKLDALTADPTTEVTPVYTAP